MSAIPVIVRAIPIFCARETRSPTTTAASAPPTTTAARAGTKTPTASDDGSLAEVVVHAVRIAFDPNQKRAGVTDHLEETIPLGGRTGSDLNVVLGFQQSPEVVEFYRRFRGR